MKTLEGRLKEFVKRQLKEMGAYYFMPVQVGYGAATLDFLCCIYGKFVAIETKAPGKKPTPRQLQVLGQIRVAGGAAFWCDSEEMFREGMYRCGFTGFQSSADQAPSARPSPPVAGSPRSE